MKNIYYFFSQLIDRLKLKIKSLKLFILCVKLYQYSIDYTQETFRTFSVFFYKIFGVKFNFIIVFEKIIRGVKTRIIFIFVKYILTFVFIIWILFEMIFFRFYLVNTPSDAQVSVDKKDVGEGYRRFLPRMLFELIMFFSRTNRRVFRILWLFFANLRALLWLIEIVYLEDLRFFFKSILNFFLRFMSFIFLLFYWLIISLFLKIFIFFYDFFFFFFKFYIIRFFFKVIDIVILLFLLPLLLFKQFCRCIFLTFPKLIFFFFFFSWEEFYSMYVSLYNLNIKGDRSLWVRSSIINSIFNMLFFFYVFANYSNLKGDSLNWWFIINYKLLNIFKYFYSKFFFFFILLWILYLFIMGVFYFIFFVFLLHPFFF